MCCLLYASNRWWWKPISDVAFLHDHFNDLLLVPCALPVTLALESLCGVRRWPQTPTAGAIAAYTIGWSVVCEGLSPAVSDVSTRDAWDVVAYMAGGTASALWYRRRGSMRVARGVESGAAARSRVSP